MCNIMPYRSTITLYILKRDYVFTLIFFPKTKNQKDYPRNGDEIIDINAIIDVYAAAVLFKYE